MHMYRSFHLLSGSNTAVQASEVTLVKLRGAVQLTVAPVANGLGEKRFSICGCRPCDEESMSTPLSPDGSLHGTADQINGCKLVASTGMLKNERPSMVRLGVQ